MTFQEFDKFQQELIQECIKMGDTKGREYSNSADRFANFRRLSTTIGIPDYQIAYIYLAKHLDSIGSFVKNGVEFSSEGIRGRIVDSIVYLTLMAGMIKEMQDYQAGQRIMERQKV